MFLIFVDGDAPCGYASLTYSVLCELQAVVIESSGCTLDDVTKGAGDGICSSSRCWFHYKKCRRFGLICRGFWSLSLEVCYQ